MKHAETSPCTPKTFGADHPRLRWLPCTIPGATRNAASAPTVTYVERNGRQPSRFATAAAGIQLYLLQVRARAVEACRISTKTPPWSAKGRCAPLLLYQSISKNDILSR